VKSSRRLHEGCSRHQCPGQRRTQTTIDAGSCSALAAHLVEEQGALLKSGATEQQLFEVIARPYLATLIDPDTRAWLRALMSTAELVTVTERIAACRDPTDDKFLELAVNGHADLIVSGDADLLALNPFRDIPILTPAAFLHGTRALQSERPFARRTNGMASHAEGTHR